MSVSKALKDPFITGSFTFIHLVCNNQLTNDEYPRIVLYNKSQISKRVDLILVKKITTNIQCKKGHSVNNWKSTSNAFKLQSDRTS